MTTHSRHSTRAHTLPNPPLQVRSLDGIPPLVGLLEALDIKVQRAAAGSLRTLAFKNEGNKEQVRPRGRSQQPRRGGGGGHGACTHRVHAHDTCVVKHTPVPGSLPAAADRGVRGAACPHPDAVL